MRDLPAQMLPFSWNPGLHSHKPSRRTVPFENTVIVGFFRFSTVLVTHCPSTVSLSPDWLGTGEAGNTVSR